MRRPLIQRQFIPPPDHLCARCGVLLRHSDKTESVNMDVQEAARLLSSHSGMVTSWIIDNHQLFRQAYRLAAKTLHPDRASDDREFKRLQSAKDILENHHATSV